MPLLSVICQFQKANTEAKCKCKGKCIGKCFWCPKCGIYILDAAFKPDLSISEGKYKAKCKCKSKCIGKCFWCPKCGIYILNAPLKRDLSISEGKYKGKNANAKANAQENGFYALNAAFFSWMLFEAWFVNFRRQIQRQNVNAKANA